MPRSATTADSGPAAASIRTTAAVSGTRCSIARSLETLGQKWMLLIVREAFWGRTRFAEFRERLGIAPDVLSDRLATLVEQGILSRQAYRNEGERERTEYVLTPAGRDLLPVLTAYLAWGDEHRPAGPGPSARPVEAASGRPLRMVYVDADGIEVPLDQVAIAPGEGGSGLDEPDR